MQEFKPVKEGKVREIFDIGDAMIIVTTDRISAFDHILRNQVPGKGKVLTKMSKFWFDFTKELVPNHMLTIDNKEMPPYFQAPVFLNKSMKCKKLRMIPECLQSIPYLHFQMAFDIVCTTKQSTLPSVHE